MPPEGPEDDGEDAMMGGHRPPDPPDSDHESQFRPSSPTSQNVGPVTAAPPMRYGSGTCMPGLVPPGRSPSGLSMTLFASGLPSLAPPGRQPSGTYGEQVRSWGEIVMLVPEESAAQTVMPPRRTESFAGSFNNRLNSSLIPKRMGEDNESPTTFGVKPKKEPPPPTRVGKNNATKPSSHNRTASTIEGRKTIRLSVWDLNAKQQPLDDLALASAQSRGLVPFVKPSVRSRGLVPVPSLVPFTPKRLIDIENGTSFLVTSQKFLSTKRFQELDDEGAVIVTARATAPTARDDAVFFRERGQSLRNKIRAGDDVVRDFEFNSEVGILGGAWRGVLRRLLLWSLDGVNGLRFGRQLQLFLPFQTSYESYLIGQIIEALDESAPRKEDVDFAFKLGFKNRNVSRILVQLVGPRWDIFWHWYQQITWNRAYDAFGRLPVIGITSFPATENFPATRDHVINSSLRILLGQGAWLTRVLTGNRQGLNTDNPELNIAQNLAAESNGFELANRNQFGTYFGRQRTNQFRLDHRLPADESIVRTFVAQPMPTMINNGVVHTLRQLAKHWHNMIAQESGNFAHQRMEQLNPFETMRFHMPVVCLVLSNLRGRNRWDSQVLGPFIRKCQELKPSMGADSCYSLAREMQEYIVANLTAGVASVYDPLQNWLSAIAEACHLIEEEAKEVYQLVTSVEIGLRLGYDLMTQVRWKIPSDRELKEAILLHIKGKNPGAEVNERRIRSALLLTTPRDKRTLIELVNCGFEKTKPAQLLLNRVKTLLQRDIRREALNEAIRELSLGDYVDDFTPEMWYWLEEADKRAVYLYSGKVTGKDEHRFIHVDSGYDKLVSMKDGQTKCRTYIPVAESICRAQRCYMNIELEHGKKFTYNAFMEFSFLRIPLRRLAIVSQIFCEELDNARINFLREVQRSSQTQVSIHEMEVGTTYYTYDYGTKSYEPFHCEKEYTPADPEWQSLGRTRIVKVPPQSMIVVGGGPAGLTTVIHCTENVLKSGGIMKLYEARDAFHAGGSTFERAQIVRLDARWIAMLRYHLGTGFEDIYIPASGETDAQLGNTLPSQGFVEITIKDLENMLHIEVSRMWSKGVIQCFTDSKATYDFDNNALTKQGKVLKVDDRILRRINADGVPTANYFSWKVVNMTYTEPLGVGELTLGHEYGVYIRQENAVLPYRLVAVDLESGTYKFMALKKGSSDLQTTAHNLPAVYPKGTRGHAEVHKVVVESVQKGSKGGFVQEELLMKDIKDQLFTMDVGHTHVVESIGKPHGSKVHLSVTTYEPYGVCCISGLKISLGMHNFGEKRWGSGLLDDFRSTNDQNTRIIGDFTKMVRQPRIAEQMVELIQTSNWQAHFKKVVAESRFDSALNELDPILPKLQKAVKKHASSANTYVRQTLQTRFFETGDNFYLGMEFTREYDKWKNETADELLGGLMIKDLDKDEKEALKKFRDTLMHHIDRLWYESCLEVIRQGDVYNPGARKRVPKLYIINSYSETKLANLPVGESFRVPAEQPKNGTKEKYEVIVKQGNQIIVRNVEGYISTMDKATMVCREGNLSRGPDGNQESKVALATFPVGHYVNFRTVRLSNEARGYVFAFIGDEQSTPHFMRYSGLTGACINAMLFNNFIGGAIEGVPFMDRFARYARETNWSNSEVVTRGTSSNFGRDGFLRPGFLYKDGIDYLHSKVIEWMETGQDLKDILSHDWKAKFASSLVPRGMELNEAFMRVLYEKTQNIIFNKFLEEVEKDKTITEAGLADKLVQCRDGVLDVGTAVSPDSFWTQFFSNLDGITDSTRKRLEDYHAEIAKRTQQTIAQIVEFATKGYLYNDRIVAQMFAQPKPVDTIVDDFAVEAQNFANSLVMSAAFSAGAVAFELADQYLPDGDVRRVFAALLGALNIFMTFGTMTNVSRYKIRNEEARVEFFDGKLLEIRKGVFAVMSRQAQNAVSEKENPFVLDLQNKVQRFRERAKYYGVPDPGETGFNAAYETLLDNVNDPATIREFQTNLAAKFIADVYHQNSYIQEDLVDIFKVCVGVLELLEQEAKIPHDDKAHHLFRRLINFTPRLDDTLQRGHIYWGFLKKRRVAHWDIFIVLRYFWRLMFCASTRSNPLAPIQIETLGIINEMRAVSALHQKTVLHREIRDLWHLHWATRESDVASMLFVAAFLVHVFSWIFTISRIVSRAGGSDVVTQVAFWASLVSTLGAMLAAFHFQRKIVILVKLWYTLGRKVRTAPTTDDSAAIAKVRTVTFTQIVFTFLRLLAGYGAAVSLPWSVAEDYMMRRADNVDECDASCQIPYWIALGSLGAAILAAVLFFIVEYRVRYFLSPRLGEYICEAFREEIQQMYTILSKPLNDVDPVQEQEKEVWEYVAREFLHKYRFDTVFAADRFGSILQYLQSGMERRP